MRITRKMLECYALQVFINGFYTCMELKANKSEVK